MEQQSDYKFKENGNTTVFTCQKIIDGAAILNVYHHGDGSWEFYTNSDKDNSHTKLVSLAQIVQLDATINELFNLEYGWSATRSNTNTNWKYEQLEEDEDGDETE